MKKNLINFKVGDEFLNDLQIAARSLDVSCSQFIREAVRQKIESIAKTQHDHDDSMQSRNATAVETT